MDANRNDTAKDANITNDNDIIILDRIDFIYHQIEPVITDNRRDNPAPAVHRNKHFTGLIDVDNIFRKRVHASKQEKSKSCFLF